MKHAFLHSLVIAQTMGLFFIIVSVIMLARVDYYRDMMSKLKADSGIITVSATFALLWGLLIISIHFMWADRFEMLVSVVAGLIVLKSILWLSVPEWMLAKTQKLYAGSLYYWACVIVGIIGVLLLSKMFALHMSGMLLW